MELSSYSNARPCDVIDEVPTVSSYTPLCRAWYANAVAARPRGAPVFNQVGYRASDSEQVMMTAC